MIPGKVDGDLWAEHLSRYLFAERLAQDRRVLDLGAGVGYGAERLSRVARSVTALDIALDAMRYGREHHPGRGVRYLAAASEALPFAAGSFDLVVSFELLEHVQDAPSLLAEVRRVLVPDGIFVVSTPNRLYYSEERGEHNEFHIHEFEIPEFEQFLRAAFAHVQLFVQNHAPAVVISRPGQEGISQGRFCRPASEPIGDAQRTCHYAIAVCAAQKCQVEDLVLFPQAAGNVLREREKHVCLLQQERESERGEFQNLRHEFEERTAWALRLEAELHKAQADLQRNQGELESRTGSARASAAEMARLAGELAAARQAEEAERNARIELQQRYHRRGELGTAVRTLARNGAAFAAATAAVPFAAGLGAGALAAEALARLLPRRAPDLEPRTGGKRLATIQILNYEGRDLLSRNLPSVQEAVRRTGLPHEILVVDNGSTDGSVEMLKKDFPDVSILSLHRNHFFSAGNNAGIRHARHDVVVLLNNDMRVEPDFLDPLLRPFDDETVFAVASQIFFQDQKKLREETGLARARFVNGMLEFRHDPVPDDLRGAIPIFWAGGGSAAFDRRKYLELGGLDLLYDPFYCEDSDLSLRAWQRGWKVLFAPESKVHHEHRSTSRRVFGEDFVNEMVRRNTLLLHWANIRDPALFAEHLLHLPRIAALQVRRHGRSGLRSLMRAALRAPRALGRRLRERADGPTDKEIVERTDWGLPAGESRAAKGRAPNEPLRIAMLSPYHVYPVQHGGAVRMYHVLRGLAARGHDVSLVGFVDDEAQLEAARHLREFCSEVRLLVRPGASGRRRLGVPGSVLEFDHPELHRLLADLEARRELDVVQVEYTQMASYARPSSRTVWCLTEHDVSFVSLYRHAAARSGRMERVRGYLDYLKMFRYELRALRNFDVVFAVTPREARVLSAYLDGEVRVSDAAPTGVDVQSLEGIVRRSGPPSLLFVGYFLHSPNVDAVLYLANEILPRIWAVAPQVSLAIAGAEPPPEVRRLADDPRVTVAGFVPELSSHYARATAFVSPVRVAAGVRVKVLEAFAAGVPVVSSSQGAEGIEVADGRELLLADSPGAFAEKVLSLISSPELQESVAGRARQFVRERYSWPSIVASLEEEYRRALWRKRKERAA